MSSSRREFITLLGGAAAAWSFPTSAQQPKGPTIGFLGGTTAATQSQWTAAFVQRLGELSHLRDILWLGLRF
jgi:putative ABC transport system substrate-binding protein